MNNSNFFRNNFRRAALASVVALGAFGASNSFAAVATSNSTATVIEPIGITKMTDLDFGKFTASAGAVTVATDGNRSTTGPVLSGGATAAKFDVTGDNNATYSITWGGDTVLTHADTTTMALTRRSDLLGDGSGTTDVTSGTLSASGAQSIYLGGELTVSGTQSEGAYTGDVTVTVEYN